MIIKNLEHSKLLLIYFFIALTICLGLNLSILNDYIFLDANEYLYTATRNDNFYNEFIQGGRPLLGLWCKFIYGYLSSCVADLKYIRLFGLIVSVLCSLQIFQFLLKLGLKHYEATLYSVLILALPTFTVYFGWSATSEIPLLLIINFLAGQCLLRCIVYKKGVFTNFSIALVIIIASLLFYQSAAMAFVIPFVFEAVIKNTIKTKHWIHLLIFSFIIFLVYYLVFKLMLYCSGLKPLNRASIDLINLPKRFFKFYIIEIATLTKNSGFLIISKLAFFLGGLSFVGFFIINYLTKKSLLNLFIFSVVLAFSFAPNLISSQDYFSVRTIAPTAIIILFYQFWFLKKLKELYTIPKLILLVLACILLGFSSFNQHHYLAGLQTKEYNILKKEFDKIDVDDKSPVYICIPDYGFLQENKFYKNGFSDEFGNLSSVKDWSSPHLFCQLAWERKGKRDKTIIVFPRDSIFIKKKRCNNSYGLNRHINLVKLFKKGFSN